MRMTTQDEYKNVCDNIRHLRMRHGLSRTAMARRLHVSLKTLDALESGNFLERVGVNFLFYVHDAFGISPKELLTVPPVQENA